MSADYHAIYASHADRYDLLVSREDHEGNLPRLLAAKAPLAGADVIEMGAGTGRVTRIVAPLAASVHACDDAPAMLELLRARCADAGITNVTTHVADNRALPFDASRADVVVAGWTFGHATGWNPTGYLDDIRAMLAEGFRVLRPGGTFVVIETLGTGTTEPAPPRPELARYYEMLELELGFAREVIRTDYSFESPREAEELARFFFGDPLGDRLRAESASRLPENTGVWTARRLSRLGGPFGDHSSSSVTAPSSGGSSRLGAGGAVRTQRAKASRA